METAEPNLMPLQDQPFNGDTFIADKFLSLKEEFKIRCVFETGTALGGTTKWLSKHFPAVFTIEINEEYQRHARNRVGNRENVKFILGDSAKQLLPSLKQFAGNAVICFLDAHWHNHCPLREELEAIAQSGIIPIIAIHDFYVPNEPKLGFDSYNGQRFDYEWIKPLLHAIYGHSEESFNIAYNSNEESTEIKRGIIYITPNFDTTPNSIINS